jgi:exonuclease III
MKSMGGSCIFVSNGIKTSEITFLKNLERDRIFEISAIELVDFKIIVMCIYRSPNSNEEIFLELLNEAVNKVLERGHFLVICGDWNIILLHDNTHQKALLSLLLSNNSQNMVSCPTRVTKNSSSLIDVMIRNKIFYHTSTRVVELGDSDHFALVMNIVVTRPLASKEKVVKRVFLKRSIDIFNSQLKTELWDDVYLQTDVNRAYSFFLTKYLKHFLHTFPLKQVSNNKGNKSGWITQG